MRSISLVNRLEFQFMGNVARNALTLGDVDNDGCNELIIGSNKGTVCIFKGREKIQTISNLNFVSCVAVGDILNKKKNCLIIVTADGWCHIYEALDEDDSTSDETDKDKGRDEIDGPLHSVMGVLESSVDSNKSRNSNKCIKQRLTCIHTQRIPPNAKNIVLGDIDDDGQIEMILGLTDRVVRSYRWFNATSGNRTLDLSDKECSSASHIGKLVALNKWECANQIGSITLHHSSDGKPSLLIAQPGGTFMRIRCQQSDDEKSQSQDTSSSKASSESIPGSAIDYQFLGISRMRNQNISTEILGDFKTGDSNQEQKKCPYAVATLDGTIMLVQDEILWAIAVDHQIFALTKLDVTGNGKDDIVVCSWDGQTYILDQDKNPIRFHLDEPVQAFHSGFYNLSPNEPPVTCLVYVTFKNTIILYYDIPLKELMCKKYEPDVELLSKLYISDTVSSNDALDIVRDMDKKTRNRLIQYLLYNVRK